MKSVLFGIRLVCLITEGSQMGLAGTSAKLVKLCHYSMNVVGMLGSGYELKREQCSTKYYAGVGDLSKNGIFCLRSEVFNHAIGIGIIALRDQLICEFDIYSGICSCSSNPMP